MCKIVMLTWEILMRVSTQLQQQNCVRDTPATAANKDANPESDWQVAWELRTDERYSFTVAIRNEELP